MEDARTTAARTHFDRWSETYERDAAKGWLREVQTAALAALALNPDDAFLDLGCGTGAAVREAAPNVRRAVGLDLSPGMIAAARELADANGLDNAEFQTGDVSGRLPFEDRAFTAILCTTAFHHFPRPRETIAEMSRVLVPRGRVVIADANRRHPVVYVLDLILRVLQPSHVGFVSPKQLMHDLCETGFDSTSYCTIKSRSYVFVRGERGPARRATTRISRPLARAS